uniref:SH3 domain-containing protein n=1 Tax=Cucumis melo TaxID=3656 RepID=A0A9I9CYN7_CUCME
MIVANMEPIIRIAVHPLRRLFLISVHRIVQLKTRGKLYLESWEIRYKPQVCDPLRAQITGAPLEDARHLTHRYDKLRQEVEIQAAEVLRRRAKSRDSSISAESATRLENAEARLSELKSTMMALGREATTAMQSVEAQQQQVTYERLRTMVDAERSYHQHALTNLERLNYELIQLAQSDGSLSTAALVTDTNTVPTIRNGEESDQPSEYKKTTSKKSDARGPLDENKDYIIAKVIHPFDAQADGELSLSIDDYVMLRQVWPNGWSEGECKGKTGWFPSAYVEKQENISLGDLCQVQSTSRSLSHSKSP